MSSRPQQHRQKSHDLPGLARYESRPDYGPILPPVWDAFATHGDGVCAAIQSRHPLMGRLPGIPGLIVERSSDLQFNEPFANQKTVRTSY